MAIIIIDGHIGSDACISEYISLKQSHCAQCLKKRAF